ncbi:MAG: InlB B-repeat-containing protein [Methanosarcinales archaeon]|jgi:uncharacterized repeat protein (TIGR02543 family)|nr:InlB B-repeat-containing protein [Methanosarcinales archaeon]
MKHLRKAASLMISILIILSAFGGMVAAEPEFFQANVKFIEDDLTLIPNSIINDNGSMQAPLNEGNVGIQPTLQIFSTGMPNWIPTPDYGNPTVVEIHTKQELLDNILNALGTKSGSKITFKLMDDFTVLSSELDDTHFRHQFHSNAGTLYSNIDGNGKTITIIVDTPNPSRPLLNRINDVHNTSLSDRLFVKDLTVRYVGDGTHTGDVKVSPFVNDDITFCDLENIIIEVEGDIVGDYRLYEQPGISGECARTFGFASHIQTLSNEPLIIRNISITAQTIGYVSGKTPEDASNGEWLGEVKGFTTTTPRRTTLENITLNYARMDGTTTSEFIQVRGFAYFIHGAVDNVHVNVGDVYVRTQNSLNQLGSAYVVGLGDAVYMSNSTFNVSGDVKLEYLELASASLNGGGIFFYGLGEQNKGWDNEGYFYFSNNSVNIGGNLTAEAPGSVWISGLVDTQSSWNTAHTVVAIDNSVTIGGNMEGISAKKIPTNNYLRYQSVVIGMHGGVSEDVNNTFTVGGNMTSYCADGNSFLFGYARGLTNLRSNIQDSTTNIGGIMSSVSVNGSAVIHGVNSGEVGTHDGNRLIIRNIFNAPHGMYVETQTGTAQINGYGIAPSASNPNPTVVTNNSVAVNGNMTVKGPGLVAVAGMAYSLTNAAAGSVVSDNIIRVDGKIQSLSDIDDALTAGFITFANREITDNVVYARDGIWDAGLPTGFSLSVNANSQLTNNTVIDRPGEADDSTPPYRADYRTFTGTPADGSVTAGNFYTSLLEGQRVTNELVFNETADLWEPFSADKRPLLEISSATDFSGGVTYIITKDADIGALGLTGPDAAKATLVGNVLTMPADSIVLLTAVEDGKTVVKDIIGIGHVYSHGNITGHIFVDSNGNGVKDAGEGVANIVVNAYYGEEEVASNTTNSDGNYSITIPLLSVLNPEITLEMEYPSGYTLSSHVNNTFTDQNEIILNLQWTVPVSGQNGILIGSTYTVTYNGNGADGGTVPQDSSTYNLSEQATVLGNSGNLWKADYKFDGWNTMADGTGTLYQPGNTITMTTNVTLYAQWTPLTPPEYLAVTYNGNSASGGNVPTDSTQYSPNQPATVLGNTGIPPLWKADHRLDGWNTMADGTGTPYQSGNTITMTANVTLYAQWTLLTPPEYLTVTYNGNGASGGNVPADSTQYSPNQPATVLGNTGIPPLWKADHKLDGWNTMADGTGTPYQSGNTITMTANVTLYAQWITLTPPEYLTVSYDANGADSGTAPTDSHDYSPNEPHTVLANADLTRTGFTFNGWSYNGTTYQPGYTIFVIENVTLSAVWTPTSGGGGNGTGNATVVPPGNETENNTPPSPPSPPAPPSPPGGDETDPGYGRENVGWLVILSIIAIAIATFTIRRKVERDDENDYLRKHSIK